MKNKKARWEESILQKQFFFALLTQTINLLPKCNTFLHRISKWILIIIFLLILIALNLPVRYPYIEAKDVPDALVFGSDINNIGLRNCTYEDTILNNQEIDISGIKRYHSFEKPKAGGEFVPKFCMSLIKSAIIIPYRNRSEQLRIFVNFMHIFLQRQNIHYRIFVVEQNDLLPFNRAKMLNYGAKVAMELKFDCLILHDVDLIPLTTGNLYGCFKKPRHMSSALDKFRYNLPYYTLFGGAVAIQAKHFLKINGMSNLFYGWGGEDDDFWRRLDDAHLTPIRLGPDLSKYTMMHHKEEPKNKDRFSKLKEAKNTPDDGLKTLKNNYKIVLEDLFTRIVVS